MSETEPGPSDDIQSIFKEFTIGDNGSSKHKELVINSGRGLLHFLQSIRSQSSEVGVELEINDAFMQLMSVFQIQQENLVDVQENNLEKFIQTIINFLHIARLLRTAGFLDDAYEYYKAARDEASNSEHLSPKIAELYDRVENEMDEL